MSCASVGIESTKVTIVPVELMKGLLGTSTGLRAMYLVRCSTLSCLPSTSHAVFKFSTPRGYAISGSTMFGISSFA